MEENLPETRELEPVKTTDPQEAINLANEKKEERRLRKQGIDEAQEKKKEQ